MKAASFGSLGRSWSATLRHCALAAAASSCAKAVAMKAEATPRPWRPAWASRLRIRCTRQRCPRGMQHLGDRRLQSLMGVGDDELHTAQAAARKLAQKL